ncbi:MAG: L,D-transpeptidase [Coleofasciculaceae cyanobacterium]
MIVCFSSAAVLFWVAQAPSRSKLSTPPPPQLKQASVPKAKPTIPKNKIKQVVPITPVLKNAISLITAKVVVDLSEAKVYLYWGDRVVSTYPVAVGQPGWETPVGKFKVEKKLQNPVWQQPITGELIKPGPENPLGKRWIGFWSDQRHHIGFHGTNKEQLVGQPVSHGCLRMRNSDVQALYEQVVIGTPVIVRK